MRPIQRIKKEKKPEAQHRKEVAEDGPSGRGWDDEIDDGQCQRRNIQTDGVVNPKAAESRAASAGHEFGHEVSHRISEQREYQCADHIPTGDVKILQAAREEWRQELDDR